VKLGPLDPTYPRSLCHLDEPPELTVSGPLDDRTRRVAIVGSRAASPEAQAFAYALAYHLAKAGVVVVSGGAVGIDTMAHRGALRAGVTWCVACTGEGRVFPPCNTPLFEHIAHSSSSRMIWPLPDGTPKDASSPRYRNGVLVALSECVIVIQAAIQSGSRNAATWARELGRTLFLVPGPPWDPAFRGTMQEGADGKAEAVWSIDFLFQRLRLPPPELGDPGAIADGMTPQLPPRIVPRRRRAAPSGLTSPLAFPVDSSPWSDEEKLVFSKLSSAPIHQEVVVDRTGLPVRATLTALLTLSLKDVVVEGPDGFFRRRMAQ
jgi:DNA processing protein